MSKKETDVVLVAPGDRDEIYQSLGKQQSALEPPVWTGLLATFLRLKGYSVNIIDANAEGLTAVQTASRINDMNPHLVALVCYGHQPNASTQVMPSAGRIATAIKELFPEQKVIMLGGHVSALPLRTLEEESVEFVCTGEGPYTLSDLIEALKSGSKNLSGVRGLMYREEGTGIVKTTNPAPLVTNLDKEMPSPAFDLLPMPLYQAHGWHCYAHPDKRQPYVSLYTTLGCPFKCTFCPIQAPFREGEAVGNILNNSYRYWSPEIIVNQLEHLVKTYGVYNVKFADEMFVLNKQHVLKLCKGIIERGLHLNIWAYVRVDTAGDDEQLEWLQKAGFNWLCFGIEAGASRVRNDVSKGFNQEKVFSVIDRVRKKGIYVIGNYLFGLPEDDHSTMQETLDLAMELNCEHANFYSAMAYPGSKLYELAIQKGWPLPEKWSGFSQHSVDTTPLPTNYLAGTEVLKFRDDAWMKYFTNPKYLEMILGKFGRKTYDAIRKKTEIKLVRENV